MSDPDIVRLKHILDASLKIIEFTKDKTRSDLDNNEMLKFSLIHLIEITGEAASGLSEEFRSKTPEVPWKDMISMRNRLIHGYFDIDLNIIWKTITEDIPPLIKKLKKILEYE